MKTLIFETDLLGHRLEYLHHYYVGAVDRQDQEYVFCLPSSFSEMKRKYVWPTSPNIRFCLFSLKEQESYSNKKPYLFAFNASKLLARYVKKEKVDRVLLTTIMPLVPFINLFLPRDVKVRGIMYNFYFYNEDEYTKLRLYYEKLRLWFCAISKQVECIYTLNDSQSSNRLNKIYGTHKFTPIVDPVPEINPDDYPSLRKELKIPDSNMVFLHFGAMDKRKGTLYILDAIDLLSKEQLKNMTFIFAGQVLDCIKEQFYEKYKKVLNKCHIILYDEFCDYEFLYSLCNTADIILIPYLITNHSSGVIGYSAVFDKPVIGPSRGLIGNLIKNNNLGVTMNQIDAYHLANQLLQADVKIQSNYKYLNTVGRFINQVMM